MLEGTWLLLSCVWLGVFVWDLGLVAAIPEPLVITQQPIGSTNLAGEALNLSVAVSGRPVSYQWRKEGVNLTNATNDSLAFPALTLGQAGDYSVVATNSGMSVTSDVARVVVFPDLVGPKIISAMVQSIAPTNLIDLRFNESILAGTVSRSSFAVTRLSTGTSVTISNTAVTGPLVRLRVGGTAWELFNDYVVTVNGVKDTAGNSIAPNTRIAVSWPYWTNVLTLETAWQFHAAAFFDPQVYDLPWMDQGFIAGPWWAIGSGRFLMAPTSILPCDEATETAIGYQPEPVLFRAHFSWPDRLSHNSVLILQPQITDGAVFYLNGSVIHRINADDQPIVASTRATMRFFPPPCGQQAVSLSVSNLVTGDNVLAVALLQGPTPSMVRGFFSLKVSASYVLGPILPDPAPPVLKVVPDGTNGVTISWDGGGYALESSTNLSSPRSYPAGPWREVPDMQNPFYQTTDVRFRAFRLKSK